MKTKVIKKIGGYSLLEVLITLSLLGILSSIAAVSYTKYIKAIELKTLKQSGELFVSALHTCISSAGWKIITVSGTNKTPCFNNDTTQKEGVLKNIGFTCPGDSCRYTTEKADPLHIKDAEYACLDIRKEVRGKKYQIYISSKIADRNTYQMECISVTGTAYTDLPISKCTLTDTRWTGITGDWKDANGNQITAATSTETIRYKCLKADWGK